MEKITKTFKTNEQLWDFISQNTLLGAEVKQGELSVTFQATEAQSIPEATEEKSIVDIREEYENKFDKSVPNNKKNDINWLNKKLGKK